MRRRAPASRHGCGGPWSFCEAPRKADGHYLGGFWRAHQIPLADVHTDPAQLQVLEKWLRSYEPEKLFDWAARLIPALRALPPTGTRRMSANRVANGGLLRKPLDMPDFRTLGVEIKTTGNNPDRQRRLPRHPDTGDHEAEQGQLPALRAGRDAVQQALTPRTRLLERRGSPSTSLRTRTAATWPRTGASWRCSASTPWKGGWRATF
jgi:hypothetical protein